jgi:hypothetical protein
MSLRSTRPLRPREDPTPQPERPPIWAEGAQHRALAAGPFLHATWARSRAVAAQMLDRTGAAPARSRVAASAVRAAAILRGEADLPDTRDVAAALAPAFRPGPAAAPRPAPGLPEKDEAAALAAIRQMIHHDTPDHPALPRPARIPVASPTFDTALSVRLTAPLLAWGLALAMGPLGAALALYAHLEGQDLREIR